MKKKIVWLLAIAIIVACIAGLSNNVFTSDNNSLETLISNHLETTQANSTLVKVKVLSVIDGDTVWVDKNGTKTKVRFIGVDTPESVSSDESKNCEQGRTASKYTKGILTKGKTIYLQYDKEKQDKYGRDLAYIWLKKDVSTTSSDDIMDYMYNAQLLSKGYARPMTIEPNDTNSLLFTSLAKKAKSNNKGFWKDAKKLNWNV